MLRLYYMISHLLWHVFINLVSVHLELFISLLIFDLLLFSLFRFFFFSLVCLQQPSSPFLMFRKTLMICLALIALFQFAKAQLGPEIISPAQNETVEPGKKIDIVYQYQNMGVGNYTIDVQLWQDAAVSIPINDVVIDQPIASGNSSGVKVSFLLNSTYSWKVPHGLNDTFWLTVTEGAQTAFYKKGVNLRSRPVMLHTSAANLMTKPAGIFAVLFGVSIITFIML